MSDGGGFASWLRAYGQAWEARSAADASRLFAPEARYWETPFEEPLQGREAIVAYWEEGTGGQEDVRVLDGILVARFDDRPLCTEFREWWHRAE